MIPAHPTPRVYYRTATTLLVLLVLTVAAAFMQLGPLSGVVSLLIAVTKAILVALFFMHLRYNRGVQRVFAATGVLWLLIMLVLTLGDYLTRG
jgi:cytochrome c oxidase subunit IV